MDILQVQDRLKNFSQDQLVGEMQAPSGNAPQFLVLSEIMRRKRMQDDFAAQQGKAGSETTVAQEAIASAGVPQGGIADMARAMAPSTDMTQNTGVQAMASGGTVKKMAEGDVVVRGGVQYIEQPDGSYINEDDTRTWGQRNIGDPLRNLFQPIGEAGRAIGQPVGEALRDVGQPIGDVGREIGAAVKEQGPRFVLGPQPSEPYPPEFDPTLARPGRFEPVGEGMGLSYLPPEMDAESFARRSMAARPLSEILTPEVLSQEETKQEVARMAVEANAPRPTPPEQGPGPAFEDRGRGAKPAAPAEGIAAVAEPATLEEAIAATEPTVSTSGGGAGGGGGAGIAGAASGMTSYEQELMDALARREKAATQDKWLSLAQVGLNLMSSTNPTFGGALGEAGLAGVQAAQGARDQYEKDRLDLTGALEQSRMSRAKAAADAAKGAGGSSDGLGGFSISAGQGRLLTQINTDIERLDTMLNDPLLIGAELTPEQKMAIADAATKRDALVRYREGLIYGAPLGAEEPDDTTGDVSEE